MMLPDECIYTFSSGKRKGLACGKKCNGKYCTSHQRIMIKRAEKQIEKEKKKLEKEKKKLEKKNKKKTTLKGLAVVNWKKIEQKFNSNNNNIIPHAANADELVNVQMEQIMNVTTSTCIPVVITCSYIFKKGKYKGQPCQCKKIHKNGLCKFHYKKHKQAMDKKKAQLEKVNSNIKIKSVNFNQNKNMIITI